jgi:hypothetical protein
LIKKNWASNDKISEGGEGGENMVQSLRDSIMTKEDIPDHALERSGILHKFTDISL